jgi:PAS domain S-box-containing protein
MGAYEKDGVQYLQGLLSDITERKRLEAALESAARLPQENPDPVMRLSQGRIIDFANPSAHDLLRIWGRNLGEEVPPEIAEPAIAALGSGARRQAEVTYGGRTYLANLCPVPAANYVNLYAQNITARKRAEEEQRESEERFRSLVENLTVGIYRTTPQGRILMANLTLVRMLGYENFEELAARNLEEQGFSPDYPRRAFREHIERDGEVKGLEAAWTRRDGSVVFLRESARVVRGESGNVLWYEGMVEDITERRRAEEERQRSLEQLRALAAQQQSVREEERKRLAREIHDQLGQALTAIKIDLSFLLRELPAGEKPPAKRTASILQLVDEAIRAVRRISTELRPGILDDLGLVATLEWAGEDFQARTGTRCRLDLPREDIAVDPERATAIFRILQETLTNVARHADASQVEVRLAKEDGDLTLEVHDNGKGIPEDKLSNGESLGILGMRERALLLGGEIIISGAPGQGTIVRVRIPEARRT